MDAGLATACREFFYAQDEHRGSELRHRGAVQVQKVGQRGVMARVRGQRVRWYRVLLDFRGLESRKELGIACECPRFDDGYLCKHCWGVIETVESEVPLAIDAKSLVVVECEWFEDMGPPLTHAAGRAATGMTAWKRKLLSIGELSRQATEPMLAAPVATALKVGFDARHFFVVDISDACENQPLTIQIYGQRRKKDGDWGKLQPTRDVVRWKAWSDPRERAVMQLLCKAKGIYAYSHYEEVTNQLKMVPEIQAAALEALAATGRFVWTLAADRSVLDPKPIVFAGADPFELVVAIYPRVGADGKERLRVQPMLQRPTECVPLERINLVTRDGEVLFGGVIGCVPTEAVPLLRAWYVEGAVDVPKPSLATLMDEATQWPGVRLDLSPDLDMESRQGSPQPRLHLASPGKHPQEDPDLLVATIEMVYGDEAFPLTATTGSLWNREKRELVLRDRDAELERLADLESIGLQGDARGQLRLQRCQLPEAVIQLRRCGWEVIADGNAMRSASGFSISVASGQDWFDLHAEAEFGDTSVALPELLKALRDGKQFVTLGDGTHGLLPSEWLKQFEGVDTAGTVEEDAIRFTQTQALLLDAMLGELEDVSMDRAFKAWCEKLNSFEGVAPADAPEGFEGELRDYQRLGLGWFGFLQEFCLGGCLADDMGLGKTIQVLALLQARKAQRQRGETIDGENPIPRTSLVVVPKSLVFNWIVEATKFTPGLRVLDYTGTGRQAALEEIEPCDVVITTYGTLRNDVMLLKEQAFDYVILDEAQAIKNPASLAAKSVRLIPSQQRLAMTGTPIENHLGDLWSIFDFLNPGMLGRSLTGSKVNESDPKRLEQLAAAVRPMILRRTKENVLMELPEKNETTLYCELSAKQRKQYDELRQHYQQSLMKRVADKGLKKSKIHVLEALLRLRQAACDTRLLDRQKGVVGAKISMLMEQLDEVLGEGHKALVFSQFTSLLSLVKESLDARDYRYEYLDGQTRNRQECVDRFQNDGDCKLFLISLKAGGHGLNLTSADYVYIMDPWWNPAVEAQAVDRAHRMGQVKPVMAYRLIARDTVEEKIAELQESKRQLADAIISEQKSLISELSGDDLRWLFS